ncbi:PilT/PilU family type 4a pilus ATPase [Deinococcus sp. 14RED07]|uniref:type IV pilus twitching motility protein PilT n=1 Tax=unclassified Deinococcus TaxID=2623546 RepID=UPI001E3E3899|nr:MULTISPECIES: PilT/PilU family type 4a pilus ATPase [unclassified Deinococcus]MCD0159894.1 PilT/PilU family type 4a pilus ATPase [Deinococcus sp. 6YEL10]MCD0164131.1 PilT/PilU family type 4a pilus ATPase [Deinococcus sp. 12RED42]MCD0174377.1 PilT/PilU family type 4a pilus ATPase [Deinococcus sp. 14RED07]
MIPVTPENISTVLDDLTRAGASDIQLKTGQPPLIALHGAWTPQTQYALLTGNDVTNLHQKLCRDTRYRDIPDSQPWDADYRTSTSLSNFRVSGGKEHGRPYLVLRPLPREIPSFNELRLLDDEMGEAPHGVGHLTEGFKWVMRQKRGLILVTGPTGSGKSTTLASFVDHVNRTQCHNIITIEDPIEFVFRSKRSQILQREVGVDTGSFSGALRAALRQKPDIILVGEMRDAETINAAFRAAATGHLVLSTLHNNESAATVERIINEFPAEEQNRARHALSEILVGIFAQQLVPTTTGKRQVIHEAMVLTSNQRSIIRPNGETDNGYLQSLRDTLKARNPYGNRSMDNELKRAVAAGIISEEVAQEYAIQPEKWSAE